MYYQPKTNLVRQAAKEEASEEAASPSVATLTDWQASLSRIGDAVTAWAVQLSPVWYTDLAWMRLRDSIDLELFRKVMEVGPSVSYRRIVPYSLRSGFGGVSEDLIRARTEHKAWISRVLSQLVAVGAPGSAAPTDTSAADYVVLLALEPGTGQKRPFDIPDGIWLDCRPPSCVAEAWASASCIPLDPHQTNIVGPYADRNPLWAGSAE